MCVFAFFPARSGYTLESQSFARRVIPCDFELATVCIGYELQSGQRTMFSFH